MSKKELIAEITECAWVATNAIEQERYSDVEPELKRIREITKALSD